MARIPYAGENAEFGDAFRDRYRSEGWQERERCIGVVLSRHIPKASENEIRRIAREVEHAWDFGTEGRARVTKIRSFKADLKILRGAAWAKDKDVAMKKVNKLGFLGEEALERAYFHMTAAAFSKENQSVGPHDVPSPMPGPAEIVAELSRQNAYLREAVRILDVDARLAEFFDIEDEGKKRGRRHEIVGLAVTSALSRPYERLTGNKAVVRSEDGVAYGPFLDLVNDVFQALGMPASPEGRIKGQRSKAKDKSRKK